MGPTRQYKAHTLSSNGTVVPPLYLDSEIITGIYPDRLTVTRTTLLLFLCLAMKSRTSFMSLSSSRQAGFGCVAKYCSAEKFWVSFGVGVSGILGVYQELIWRASLLQCSHSLEMDNGLPRHDRRTVCISCPVALPKVYLCGFDTGIGYAPVRPLRSSPLLCSTTHSLLSRPCKPHPYVPHLECHAVRLYLVLSRSHVKSQLPCSPYFSCLITRSQPWRLDGICSTSTPQVKVFRRPNFITPYCSSLSRLVHST